MNIWVGNGGVANPDNIKNCNVEFRVRKEEITPDEESRVALQRYSDGNRTLLRLPKLGKMSSTSSIKPKLLVSLRM
jgi:PGF-pre-PGF domain-containing protein